MASRMTIAYWCVLVAALLPYACAYMAKAGGFGKPRSQGGFDNHEPRAWLAKLTDWRARANAAQANSFEALPLFIAAVLIAHQLAAPRVLVDVLAVLYVTLRVMYIAMYVAGLSTVRSAIWALALLVNVGIFLSALH